MINALRMRFAPGHVVIFSVIITIVAGTLFLALPIARHKPMPLTDLVFTATSATCVTGFTTVPLEDFTRFGQSIILILMQIGGLGLITITFFLVYFFLSLGFSGSVILSELLDIGSWVYVRRTIILIIFVTLISECVGALLIFNIIRATIPAPTAAFFALFHAVSSFCNAGIVVSDDLINTYGHHVPLLTVTVILMFCGGFGFITWYELGRWLTRKIQKKRYQFSLQTLIVIRWTFGFVLCTTLFYFFLEQKHTLANVSIPFGILSAFFHAISFKGTGFVLENISAFHPATVCLFLCIAFIGSAPGSTGSGIKLTTFAIFLATIKAIILGRTEVDIYNRSIAHEQVLRAIAIIAVSILWILSSAFLLLITESNWKVDDVLVEAFSAFTTLGISTGSTASLSLLGKMNVIASMIIGRIGSLTLLLSLKFPQQEEKAIFSYPEERVMLG